MSKQIEAMKLALEKALSLLIDNREYIEANERSVYLEVYDNAIAEAGKALAEQPAQQEPVAWMHTMIDDVVIGHRPADIARHPDRWTPLYTAPSPCPTCEALARTVMMDQTSHDTPPAQRKPLTDEQKQQLAENWFAEDWAITKAIGMMFDHELLLGIKE